MANIRISSASSSGERKEKNVFNPASVYHNAQYLWPSVSSSAIPFAANTLLFMV